MKPRNLKSLQEFAPLKSHDEREFYVQTANYFFERAAKYHYRFTAYFFSGDAGVFEIISVREFETEKKLRKFQESLFRREYHIVLGPYDGKPHFSFNGKFLFAMEIHKKIRRVVVYDWGQELKDIMEGKKKRPPRTSAFRDMLIGKALEIHAATTDTNKRKLAS